MRERMKVRRGRKRMDTAIAERQRIKYNFVKLQMALEGQTSAGNAGIGVEAKDKWMELIKRAIAE